MSEFFCIRFSYGTKVCVAEFDVGCSKLSHFSVCNILIFILRHCCNQRIRLDLFGHILEHKLWNGKVKIYF